MFTRLLTIFTCAMAALNCCAQILPAPGAKLTYNQVMFEYEKVKGAALYIVRVEEDTKGSDTIGRFSENCSVEQTDSSTATVIDGLTFGRKYRWMYAGLKPGQEPAWKGPYFFEITRDTLLNNVMSINVTTNFAGANAGGLIVNDCTHTIVDREGKLVWYLANVNWHYSKLNEPVSLNPTLPGRGTVNNTNHKFEVKPVIYDLKLTPYGTITDLEDSFPLERDLNNNIIWKAPNDDRVSGMFYEYYNHDFKRLANGHYMVLGNQVWRLLPDYCDTAAIKKKYPEIKLFGGKQYARVDFGTIIEYDKNKNVVWSWKSQNYFDSDALKPITGDLRLHFELKPHINAFSVDRDNKFVYAGFRDASRIVKIEKATGNVVDSWGPKTLAAAMHKVPIHGQHDANVLDNGNIAVFDNNDYPGRDSIPSVIIFSQQATDSGHIVWKYDCSLPPGQRRAKRTGGNVDQLKNGNFLVCMGDVDKISEITKDKRVVWQAEIKPNIKRSFDYVHRLYRAHYVSSLYPCYFTFQTDEDTVRKISSRFNIRVFNEGSENDAYSVKVISASGSVISQFTTDTVLPGRSETFAVDPHKHIRFHDKIEVTVSSQTNTDNERRGLVVVGRQAGH